MEAEKCIHLARARKDDGVVLVQQWTQNPGKSVFSVSPKDRKRPVSQLKAARKEGSSLLLGVSAFFFLLRLLGWWGLSKSGRAGRTTESINANVNLIQKQPHTTHRVCFGLTSGLLLVPVKLKHHIQSLSLREEWSPSQQPDGSIGSKLRLQLSWCHMISVFAGVSGFILITRKT